MARRMIVLPEEVYENLSQTTAAAKSQLQDPYTAKLFQAGTDVSRTLHDPTERSDDEKFLRHDQAVKTMLRLKHLPAGNSPPAPSNATVDNVAASLLSVLQQLNLRVNNNNNNSVGTPGSQMQEPLNHDGAIANAYPVRETTAKYEKEEDSLGNAPVTHQSFDDTALDAKKTGLRDRDPSIPRRPRLSNTSVSQPQHPQQQQQRLPVGLEFDDPRRQEELQALAETLKQERKPSRIPIKSTGRAIGKHPRSANNRKKHVRIKHEPIDVDEGAAENSPPDMEEEDVTDGDVPAPRPIKLDPTRARIRQLSVLRNETSHGRDKTPFKTNRRYESLYRTSNQPREVDEKLYRRNASQKGSGGRRARQSHLLKPRLWRRL